VSEQFFQIIVRIKAQHERERAVKRLKQFGLPDLLHAVAPMKRRENAKTACLY